MAAKPKPAPDPVRLTVEEWRHASIVFRFGCPARHEGLCSVCYDIALKIDCRLAAPVAPAKKRGKG